MVEPLRAERRKWRANRGADFGGLEFEEERPNLPRDRKPEMADSGAEDPESDWEEEQDLLFDL
jgi:hypothetical protein